MKSLITLISIILFSATTVLGGGGWPAGKGKGYIKLAEWWVISDKFYTSTGQVESGINRGIYNTTLYGEYGLSDKWTVIAYLPVFSRATVDAELGSGGNVLSPSDAINGIGDADLGIKYSFNTSKSIALSGTLYLGIPLGESEGGTSGTLQIGDGEFNQMLRFDAGTGFTISGINGYANLFAAYNNRTNGFSDEVRWGAEVGVNALKNKLGLTLRVASISSTDNGSAGVGENSRSIFSNNTEFFSVSPEIRYNFLDRWGISANYATASGGQNIFASPSYSVGIYHQW